LRAQLIAHIGTAATPVFDLLQRLNVIISKGFYALLRAFGMGWQRPRSLKIIFQRLFQAIIIYV